MIGQWQMLSLHWSIITAGLLKVGNSWYHHPKTKQPLAAQLLSIYNRQEGAMWERMRPAMFVRDYPIFFACIL